MYRMVETKRGYAIYFKETEESYHDRNKKIEFISDNLSAKQAGKWCDRLNEAYRKGLSANS